MFNKDKTIVLGDGYLGSAYKEVGYQTTDKQNFNPLIHNWKYLESILEPFDIIINTIAVTDTSENPKNKKEMFIVNSDFVRNLSEYCNLKNKRMVQISTGDLYNQPSPFCRKCTVESTKFLDTNTPYRLSKALAEQYCNDKTIIIRPRLLFDDRVHVKNLITKSRNFEKFYSFQNSFSFVKDIIGGINALLENNCFGIYNIVQENNDGASLLYLYRNLLKFPHLQHIDLHNDQDPNLIFELSNVHIHNILNVDKISQYYKLQSLESSFISSYYKHEEAMKSC